MTNTTTCPHCGAGRRQMRIIGDLFQCNECRGRYMISDQLKATVTPDPPSPRITPLGDRYVLVSAAGVQVGGVMPPDVAAWSAMWAEALK